MAPLVLLLFLQYHASPVSNLKTVDLGRGYKIQVPPTFAAHQLPVQASSVSATAFTSDVGNRRTWFEVILQQYGDDTTVVIDTSKPHFTVSGGRQVYYKWDVTDNAYECSMNSPCPLPVKTEYRYTTMYEFDLFDKATDTMLKFRGTYTGRSKEISGFEGVGRLLHDVVVPSLTPIH